MPDTGTSPDDAPPDPNALLAELEAAFGVFEEARVRLQGACAAAAQGLVAAIERIRRAEADLETAKNHLAQTKTETAAERTEMLLKVATLEGELSVLKEAHDKAASEAAEALAAATAAREAATQDAQKRAELEQAVQALTEHATQLALERDAHGQHAAAVEAELRATREALESEIAQIGEGHEKATEEAQHQTETQAARIAELELTVASVTEHASALVEERDAAAERLKVVENELQGVREALARRPGLDYVAAIEKQKVRAEEELANAKVELERLKRDMAGVKTRLSKSTSSTRIPALQAPTPEAKAFADSTAASPSSSGPVPRPEKPPGALNLDEILSRAKAVKKPTS